MPGVDHHQRPVRVALTRDDDRYLVLRERFGVARRLRGDLFISVHCDSTGSEDATGASVYTLSEVASDKESARLAARSPDRRRVRVLVLGHPVALPPAGEGRRPDRRGSLRSVDSVCRVDAGN